jgi:hypothetical protein
LHKEGKTQDAVALAEKLPEVGRQARVENDLRFAESLAKAGDVIQAEGDLTKAQEFYFRAKEIRKQKLGANDPATVAMDNRLGNMYQMAMNSPSGSALPAAPNSTDQHLVKGHFNVTAKHDVKREQAYAQGAHVLRDNITRQNPHHIKEKIVPVMTRALQDAKSPELRLGLVQALGELGPAANEAVPALNACLQHPQTPDESRAVVRALGQMGPAADKAFPVLVEALKNSNPDVRRSAAEALLCYGPAGRSVLNRYAADGEASQKKMVTELLENGALADGYIGVKDTNNLFTLNTLKDTQRDMAALVQDKKIAVYTETYVASTSSSEDKGKDRVPPPDVDGVHLLIYKDPPHAEVIVSQALLRRGFTARHQGELRQAIEKHLKEKDFDSALREAMRFLARFDLTQPDRKRGAKN